MSHIFLSYSHKDTDYAHMLAESLQSKGLEVWIDERLDYGSQWPIEIQRQLDSCDAFVLIMSPRSFESDWVQSELQRAKRKAKPIFPLLLEGDEPWLSVESTQYYDVRDGQVPDARFFVAIGRVVTPSESLESVPISKSFIKSPSSQQTAKAEPKIKTELVIAIIGLIGTIVAGLLASPLVERWFGAAATPSPIATESPIFQLVTDTPTIVVRSFTPIISPGDVVDSKGVVMVIVPAGIFTMGNDNGDDNEKPPHEVYLDTYYIDKYEVTNALYKTCVEAGTCKLPSDVEHYNDPKYINHPVVNIDWQMAQTYCEWRGTRLPTEAEWEKAARGTDDSLYPWGDTASCKYANYYGCVGDTAEIGKYENGASPYGVHDMGGNVWEWVADWYWSDYYRILGSDASNPQGPTSGEGRSIRGGGFNDDSTWMRVSARYRWNAFDNNTGFRCARPEPISVTATTVVTLTATAEKEYLPVENETMVLVPAGEFTMGSDYEYDDSKPSHEVYLDAYYIDKHEVTNAFYKACVDVGVCDLPHSIGSSTRENYFGSSEFDNYPVIFVDWFMAKTYCEWRGARLPTEAEWEKAARGTDERTYPWGEEIGCSKANYDYCVGDTTSAGSYVSGKGPYGIYDLTGNVWEWVSSLYYPYPYNPTDGRENLDVSGNRVMRGVSWADSGPLIYRWKGLPDHYTYNIGFRCARDTTP